MSAHKDQPGVSGTEHCIFVTVIVKASSGPRYVVGCRTKVDKAKLKAGTRVALDMTTLTIMRALPREVGTIMLPSVLSFTTLAVLIPLQACSMSLHLA